MQLYKILISILLLTSSVSAAQISVGDGSFAVASGDMLELSGFANGSSSAWMWLFTFEEDASIHGAPITVIGDNYKTNVVNITKLPEGRYPLVIEFGGDNELQEVLYIYNNKTFQYEFISPWRAPAAMEADENPYARIKQVKQYCDLNKKYCDDTFYATNVTIEHPFIKFTDMYQYQYSDIYQGKSGEKDITKSGLLYLGGTTNMDPKNIITIVLDHNQTVKAVTEKVTSDGYYKWSAFLDISKLRTGSHPIDISSIKTDTITTYLEIGLEKVTPKPTPTPIKVVRNEFVSTAGNTIDRPDTETTITPAPSQFISVVNPGITPVPTVVPTSIDNAPLSNPDIGDKIIVEPTKSNKLPLNPIVTIIGLGISIFIIMRSKKS